MYSSRSSHNSSDSSSNSDEDDFDDSLDALFPIEKMHNEGSALLVPTVRNCDMCSQGCLSNGRNGFEDVLNSSILSNAKHMNTKSLGLSGELSNVWKALERSLLSIPCQDVSDSRSSFIEKIELDYSAERTSSASLSNTSTTSSFLDRSNELDKRLSTEHCIVASELSWSPTAVDPITKFSYSFLIPKEYILDIYKTMLCMQDRCRVRSNFLEKQRDLSESMRRVIIDWITDRHHFFGLKLGTLHTTIFLLDRLLSIVKFQNDKAEVLAAVALMLSSKIEEYRPLCITDVSKHCIPDSKPFDNIAIMRVEQHALHCLDYSLLASTSYTFSAYFTTLLVQDRCHIEMVNFLLQLSLRYTSFYRYQPSRIAIAALHVVRFFMYNDTSILAEKESELCRFFSINEKEFAPIVVELKFAVRESPRIATKLFVQYSTPLHRSVALIAYSRWVCSVFPNRKKVPPLAKIARLSSVCQKVFPKTTIKNCRQMLNHSI